MDAVVKTVAVYLFLLVVFRLVGRRTMASLTIFDFVLVLIISEAAQQALVGEDFSVTNAVIIITTLLVLDIGFAMIKQRFKKVEKVLDGIPTIILVNGQPIKDRMQKSRIDEEDILQSARELQGLERLEQIKYAILEKNGTITIVPAQSEQK